MQTKAIILEIGSSCQSNEINMQKISFLRSISLYSWSGQKGMTYECIIADVDENFPWMNRSKKYGNKLLISDIKGEYNCDIHGLLPSKITFLY